MPLKRSEHGHQQHNPQPSPRRRITDNDLSAAPRELKDQATCRLGPSEIMPSVRNDLCMISAKRCVNARYKPGQKVFLEMSRPEMEMLYLGPPRVGWCDGCGSLTELRAGAFT